MRSFRFLLLGLVAILAAAGCSEMTSPAIHSAGTPGRPQALAAGSPHGVPLVAPLVGQGGRLTIGTVTVENDAARLSVRFETGGGWAMLETRIEASRRTAPASPGRRGAVRPSRFEQREFHDPAAVIAEHILDLQACGFAPGDTIFVLAQTRGARFDGQGRPRQRIVAWGGAEPYPGRGPERRLTYVIQAGAPAEPCRLELTWPVGGESICEGGSAEVLWSASGACAGAVRIELLLEGVACQLLAESAPNTGVFLWEDVQRSEFETDGYTLRISAVEGEGEDESGAPFAIDQCGGPE